MNLGRHLFQKEWLVVRSVVMVLAVLHLARLGLMLGWFGSPAPSGVGWAWMAVFSSMVGYAVMGLSAAMMISVLAADSPALRETFVATRPVRKMTLVWVKAAALLLFVSLPYVVVEFLMLWLTGQSAAVIGQGTLQMALMVTVFLALLIPAVWWWGSKWEAWLGISVAMVGGWVAFSLSLGYLETTRMGSSLWAVKGAFQVERVLWVMAVGAVVLWVFLIFQWNRGKMWRVGRRLGCFFLLGMAGVAALIFGPREKGEFVSVKRMVEVTLRSPVDGEMNTVIALKVGANSLAEDREILWGIESAAVDGQEVLMPMKLPITERVALQLERGTEGGRALNCTLREILGAGYVFLGVRDGVSVEIQGRVPNHYLSKGEVVMSLHLEGKVIRWEKAAELKLAEGSADGDWTLEHLWNPKGTQQSLVNLGLQVRTTQLWGEVPFNLKMQRLVLVNDRLRTARVITAPWQKTTFGTHGAAPWLGALVPHVRLDTAAFAKNMIPEKREDFRLLIFRPRFEESVKLAWDGKVRVRPAWRSQGLAQRVKDLKPEAVAEWMRKNVPPDATVSERDLAQYLVKLIGELNRCQRHLREGHSAVRWLKELVPEHLELLIRARENIAMDDHTARSTITRAIELGFERAQLPQLVGASGVLLRADKMGWLEDVAEELLVRTRGGDENALVYALKLPERGGLTSEELVSLFLTEPKAFTYKTLRDLPEVKRAMDEALDEWKEKALLSLNSMDMDVCPELEVVLARGDPDGPALLWRTTEVSTQGGTHDQLFYEYFNSREWGRSGSQLWEFFMKQDPADFVFDSESEKYHLKGEKR